MDFGALARALTPALNGYYAGQRQRSQDDFQRQVALEREQRAAEAAAQQRALTGLQMQKLQQELSPEAINDQHLLMRARALSALPELKAPDQLPGGTEPSDFKPWYTRAGYHDPAEFYTDLRHRQAITDNPPAPKTPNYQHALDNVATAAGGDLAETYRRVNRDPKLFGALGSGAITNSDVEAADTRAQQRASSVGLMARVLGGLAGGPGAGGDVPAQYRKFPSESPDQWVERLKGRGVSPDQIMQYGRAQGITVDSTAFVDKPGFFSRLFGGGD